MDQFKSPAFSIVLLLACVVIVHAQEDGWEAGEEVIQVPTVVVTVTRTPRSVESLTNSADVVDRDDLNLLQAVTLEEAVADLPGLTVVGNARYGQEVRLDARGVTSGFGTQRTLVLLDGRPLTDEYLGTVDLAQYPLDALSRVELVRGPASALYGTNALGGVVNLIPRRGTAVPRTELSGQGGTFASAHASLSHGRTLGPVDLFLNLSGSGTDGYLRNSRGDGMDWETRSAFLNLGYDRERVGLRFYGGFFRGEGTDEDFDRDLKRFLGDLALAIRHGPGEESVTRLRLYRSELDQTLAWFLRPEAGFDQSSTGAILDQTHRVHPAHLVTGGLEWRDESATVDELAGVVDREATTWSAFLQDEIEAGERVRLVLGLRFDERPGLDGQLSYRAGANYRPAAGTILRSSVGRAFRAPALSDRFLPTTSFFGVTFEGNPHLGPEDILSVELGVDQRIGGAVTGSLIGFATRANDFWDFLMEPDGVFRPRNIARVDIYGFEAQLEAHLGEGFEAAGSYTFTNARYDRLEGNATVEGNRLDDNVLHAGAVSLTYRHPARHAVNLLIRASGDRFTDPENTPEGRLPSFVLADVRATVQLVQTVAVTLEVENLLNSTYRTRPEFVQPGRVLFGGLRFEFR